MILRQPRTVLSAMFLGMALGCARSRTPVTEADLGNCCGELCQSGIQSPLCPPEPESPKLTAHTLPTSPPEEFAPRKAGHPPLVLQDVLTSIEYNFPLILAAEQEYAIALGQRVAAEGGFDLNSRTRVFEQGGTFPSDRLDTVLEQPTQFNGLSLLAGYRYGFGDFPVYYGDRKTADDGEFRAGIQIPLLKDGAIDRRRAVLQQAKISQNMADPLVRRVRIDSLRTGAKAYWNWVSAGEQVRVAENLLRIARERQTGLAEQFQTGQIAEFSVIDNRRLLIEREGVLNTAQRRWQQTCFELSLYLRGPEGDPFIATAAHLPENFAETEVLAPPVRQLAVDVEAAWRQRPELQRLKLQRERLMVEVRLQENQALPALNVGAVASQDVGTAKNSPGIFALDRTVYEGQITLEMPLQRRDARGKLLASQAAMTQLLQQERFTRDSIQAEVQDVHSSLDRNQQRLRLARQEQQIAERVADLERERFVRGQGTLLEVNFRELAAAGARTKVIESLTEFQRALADYQAALGWMGDLSPAP